MKQILLNIALALFVSLQASAQTYTYDNLNRMTKVVYDNGTTITYSFDALGNRTSKKVIGATAETYTISIDVSPSGSGTVTGGGTYAKGASIELKAIPNAGYEFLKWSDGNKDNPRTVTVTKNISYTAQFKESDVTPELIGDIVVDGKVNQQDLNALVNAYLSGASATKVTDLDDDQLLSIADITTLIAIINDSSIPLNNNGHQFVDLGLPSGTLWATCNVGASAPEESGELYAWGETETKEEYSWSTYKWCDGDNCNLSNQTLTKYCDRGAYGKLDGKISLESEDDVAHVKWGGDWHIPTKEQFQELMDNCTMEWVKINDALHAYKFTGTNGNSIIMPAAGEYNKCNYSEDEFHYWSAELHMSDIAANNHATHVVVMEYGSKNQTEFSGNYRYKGYAVRPVLSKYTPIIHQIEAPSNYRDHDLVDLGLPSGTLWAECNLGAAAPQDYGCYYAWGETNGSCDGKTSFSWSTYEYYNGSEPTKYTTEGSFLEKSDDAATANWGGEWRMPTYSEIIELENTKYTVCEWTSVNGINGYRITSIVKGFEGNSIFLPAAGRFRPTLKDVGERGDYWASTLYSDESANYAGYLTFNSGNISKGNNPRYYGTSIRPVVSLDAINK